MTQCGEFVLTCNAGGCLYHEFSLSHNQLMKQLYIALSQAKQQHQQTLVWFDAQFEQHLVQQAERLTQLRQAISHNELFLVYQPQLHLATGEICGFETLVRWQKGEQLISPADFIPLAEQSGLIIEIGHWILNQACLFAQSLVTQGYDALVVAVNVSPRQFSHPDFYQAVVDALDNSKLAPQHLELEITEGVVMHNEQVVIQQLQRYKQLGIQLSIDDFGTGYSSLSYLKQFPVDKLKIDQSFIRQSHENTEDRILVESIVNLAHSLRLNVIAEGVELREHTEWLAALSCDEIQGYWFSRPLPATAVVPLLMSHKPSEFKCKPN